MSNLACMHCYVSGSVQGVWYRASTKKVADELKLTGWIRNLPDGRVEVLACGEKNHLTRLYDWLKKGPPLARVKNVSYEELPWQEHQGFDVT